MNKVNIHEAKTNLSSLLAEIEKKGTCIKICRSGKAVAELRPLRKKKNPLKLNPKLRVSFKESPILPLEPEDWPDLT
jgi:antitoxin (DNA-binding transcriptional repressor) of toxin-antitoxin stability system